MNTKLLNALVVIVLFLAPYLAFGQAPNLGTAAGFVLFSGDGAVTNTGNSILTGNVGTNVGSSTGFGNVNGVMEDDNGASSAAASDLLTAYNQLNTAAATFFPSPLLGNGDTLNAGVYHISSATTLSSTLILNAQGNPNAVFIFQIQGSFSTSAASKVKLINGAIANNVYWKVEGLVSMAAATVMKGTIVAHNAAITMNANDTLEGRALSTTGAVTVNGIRAYIPITGILTGPTAPALASTAAYGIFSGSGNVTNTGTTYVVGDVGTNSGLTTGFNPSYVTGTIHPAPDASTAAAASSLTNVYNYLNTLPYDIQLLYPAQFGNNLVLTPHTYLMASAPSFTDTVYLDAQGNNNAVFVFQINGALSTSTYSNVVLLNGAQAKNVYWKVDGAVNINNNSVFNGTIVANNAAINLNPGSTFSGRALTTNGAITVNGINLSLPLDTTCSAPAISGMSRVCTGDSVALSDSAAGGIWTSSDSGVAAIDSFSGELTGVTSGTSIISYTSPVGCVSATTVTVNSSPGAINGPANVCVGSSITLSDTTAGGTWSSSNTSSATAGSSSGVVSGIANGTAVITYTAPNSCIASTDVAVGAYAGSISGPSSICQGSGVTLTDTVSGGTWTNSTNSVAIIFSSSVIGVSAGTDTVGYIVTNACGTDTAMKVITVDTFQNASVIGGDSSVCIGSSIILTDSTSGGTWSASNAHASVMDSLVTGASVGIDTIIYTYTNACGSSAVTKTVTINPLPDEGSISGVSSVCVGSNITFSESASGGIWSSSNTTAFTSGGVITGENAGIDTIRYTVSGICGTRTATKTITVNPLPDAGIINGPSQVCVGSSIVLTDTASGGTWSSGNANAFVAGGTVSGDVAGSDTIFYTNSNTCGTDTAIKFITINPLPYAGVINGGTTVCTGASITLSDTTPGGMWYITNAMATGAGGVVTGVAAGLDTLYYTVSNVCGSDSTGAVIVVNTTPDPGVIMGASSVCVGSSITLVDTVADGGWSGSNMTAVVFGGIVIGAAAGIDTVSYTVTNAGCTAMATTTITVNPLPDAGTITGASTICAGTMTILTDTAMGGTWSSSNATATDSAGVITGTAPGVDTIIYTVNNVCGTATATEIVTVVPAPSAPVITTQSPSSVCSGTMYQNFGAAVMPPAGTTYNWSATNGFVWAQGAGSQYALVNFNTPGTAEVTLTATIEGAACTSQATVTVTVSASVAQTPEVVYFNNHFVCTPSNEDSYQWGYDNKYTLDSTILIGQVNQDYLNESPDFADNYYWVITTSGGCTQKTYYITPDATAVQNVNNGPVSVSIYPNPASSLINIVVADAINAPVQVDVFNMLGQKINSVMAVDNKAAIDVTTLSAGSYLITCYRNGIKIAGATFIKN